MVLGGNNGAVVDPNSPAFTDNASLDGWNLRSNTGRVNPRDVRFQPHVPLSEFDRTLPAMDGVERLQPLQAQAPPSTEWPSNVFDDLPLEGLEVDPEVFDDLTVEGFGGDPWTLALEESGEGLTDDSLQGHESDVGYLQAPQDLEAPCTEWPTDDPVAVQDYEEFLAAIDLQAEVPTLPTPPSGSLEEWMLPLIGSGLDISVPAPQHDLQGGMPMPPPQVQAQMLSSPPPPPQPQLPGPRPAGVRKTKATRRSRPAASRTSRPEPRPTLTTEEQSELSRLTDAETIKAQLKTKYEPRPAKKKDGTSSNKAGAVTGYRAVTYVASCRTCGELVSEGIKKKDKGRPVCPYHGEHPAPSPGPSA